MISAFEWGGKNQFLILGGQRLCHLPHERFGVRVKLPVALAEVVEGWLAIDKKQAVFGALPMAEELVAALTALLGQRVLELSESALSLAIDEVVEGFLHDIPQLVVRKDKMVAGIDIAIELHHQGMSTLRCHGAHARLHTHPIGKRRFKYLDIVVAYVMTHPFIEHVAKELSPLTGRDRLRRHDRA